MTTAARSAISEAIADLLLASAPSLAIQRDANDGFVPPRDEPWVRIAFADGAKTVAAIGGTSNLWRGPIVAFVDVFTPLGAGDAIAVDFCSVVREAARAITAPDLTLRRFETGPEGPVDGYFRKQQIVVFDHSERG